MIVGGLVGFGAVLPPYGVAIGAAVVWAGLASRDVRTDGRATKAAIT